MKIEIATTTLVLLAASSVNAFGTDFTGTVSMGLTGGSETSATPVTSYTNLDAQVRVSFEILGNVTVGIVLPVYGDGH